MNTLLEEVPGEEPYEKKFANLHFHTEHSDNMRPVREVIRLGVEEGFRAFGITDHDTVGGWRECKEACEEFGVEFMLGAEFYGLAFGVPFHITAFDFDPETEEMKNLLSYVKKRNTYPVKTRFDLGVQRGTIRGITWEDVLKRNEGIDFLFHNHVARTMIEKGLLKPEEKADFVKENFSKEKVPIPLPYDPPKIEDIISAVKNAGGVSIMAHPGYQDRQAYMEPLVKLGIGGIELWHPQNDAETREKILSLCEKYPLYISGGTDHHGHMEGYPLYVPGKENPPRCVPLGKFGVTKEEYEKLKNRVYG